MLTGIVLGSVWFAVFVLSHGVVLHIFSVRDRFSVIAQSFLVSSVGLGVVSLIVAARIPGGACERLFNTGVVGAVVMAALTLLYLPFYYTVNTSLSVQTLIRISGAPGRRLRQTVVRRTLSSDGLVRERLDKMVAGGYLTRDGDRYHLTRRGRRLTALFHAVKTYWRLGPGG